MKQVYNYTVYVKGIFGRNRKTKFEGFKLFEDVENKIPLDQVKEKLETVLKTVIKPKGSYWFKVIEMPMTLENDSGVTIRSFTLTAGNNLFSETRQ